MQLTDVGIICFRPDQLRYAGRSARCSVSVEQRLAQPQRQATAAGAAVPSGGHSPEAAHSFAQEPTTSSDSLLPSIRPDDIQRSITRRAQETAAYLEMARLHNVLPSALLVFVGAACAAHSWRVFLLPAVWAMAAASAGIAVSSVVVNDYFDFRQGGDLVNAPNKPLPRCVPRIEPCHTAGKSRPQRHRTSQNT
jgi:hypothetical protein